MIHPHDEEGGEGPVPWSVRDFLSVSYYAVSIVVVLLALVGFVLSMKWRVDGLESLEREHPTRQELSEIAIKVDGRITSLERHVEDLDVHGTRALVDRTTLLEQENHTQAERIAEITRRMNELQVSMNKLNGDLPVLVDRQNNNTNAVRELQQRVWGNEKGPTGPSYPH